MANKRTVIVMRKEVQDFMNEVVRFAQKMQEEHPELTLFDVAAGLTHLSGVFRNQVDFAMAQIAAQNAGPRIAIPNPGINGNNLRMREN